MRIVLVEPRYGGNVGATARAMKTMGLHDLWLVAPREHLTPEALWTAVHAQDLITGAHVAASVTAATADCVFVVGTSVRDRHLPLPVLAPRAAAAAMTSAALHGNVALLFGNETSGLSGEQLSRCNCHVRIPADPDCSSLNLAMAVQLLAYELRLAALDAVGNVAVDASGTAIARPDGPGSPAGMLVPRARPGQQATARAPSTAGQLAGLLEHAERTLTAIGFYDPRKPRLLVKRLRRLFARARLEQAEMHLLRGILAAVDRTARRGADAAVAQPARDQADPQPSGQPAQSAGVAEG